MKLQNPDLPNNNNGNINTDITHIDDFFKTAFSVDCVIFGFDNDDLKILVIKCETPPYVGQWSLLGDLVHPKEDLDAAAKRILLARTGLNHVYLEQVQAFGQVGRHPLGRVITIAYYSLVKISDYHLQPSNLDNGLSWHSITEMESMSFDHNEVLAACLKRLRQRVRNQPIGFRLLPAQFTLTELQSLYEAVLGRHLDKRNFRKKILSMNLLIEQKEPQKGVPHRPAKLYKFDQKRYDQLTSKGFVFEL
jgi:8-oxo-dGTP diphosphatase